MSAIELGKVFGISAELYAILLLMALSDVSSFEDLKKNLRTLIVEKKPPVAPETGFKDEPPIVPEAGFNNETPVELGTGSKKDFWSITIEKPWCIIFKYSEGCFVDVEVGDYHD